MFRPNLSVEIFDKNFPFVILKLAKNLLPDYVYFPSYSVKCISHFIRVFHYGEGQVDLPLTLKMAKSLLQKSALHHQNLFPPHKSFNPSPFCYPKWGIKICKKVIKSFKKRSDLILRPFLTVACIFTNDSS